MMKKLLLAILLVIWVATQAQAQVISSGVTTSSGVITTIYNGPCWVTGITLICNSTTDTDMQVVDGTSGVTHAIIRVEGSYSPSVRYNYSYPIMFNQSIRFSISNGGAATGKAIFEYVPK
jgi:hypothetical protein